MQAYFNEPFDKLRCCSQALYHYSEAMQDLQQAIQLEPDNKAFAKELDTVRKDAAEAKKQRAVLKQLNSNSSLSAKPSTTASDSGSSAAEHHKGRANCSAGAAQLASPPAELLPHSNAQHLTDAGQTLAQPEPGSQLARSSNACDTPDQQSAESQSSSDTAAMRSGDAKSSSDPAAVQRQVPNRPMSNLARMQTLVQSLQAAGRGYSTWHATSCCTHLAPSHAG